MKTRLLIKLRKEAKRKIKLRKGYGEWYGIGFRRNIFIGINCSLKAGIDSGQIVQMLEDARRDYIKDLIKVLRKKRRDKIEKQLYRQYRNL